MRQNYASRSKRHIQWGLLVALIGLFNLQGMAQSYSGGSGTSSDPYQISTLNDLKYLSEHISEWSKHFVQTAAIDASETSTWNNGDGFSPIGDMRIAQISFTGSYNGGGNEIINLTINRVKSVSDSSHDFTGLFGDTSGPVSNLGLRNASIISNGLYTGAIAGYVREYSNGSIINCYATGTVYGYQYTGGITGLNAGNIHNTFFNGDINSSGYRRGGIAGTAKHSHANISNCYAISPFYSGTEVGPVLGRSLEFAPNVKNSFYSSSEYSGSSNIYGAIALATADFADETNFTDWDFSNTWITATLPEFDVDNAYPYLQWMFGYTIYFVSNGGSGSMDAMMNVLGDTRLTFNTFTNGNYAFIGWATSADGDVVYQDEETIDVSENITLYATWDTATGIGDIDTGKVNIYPNPALDYVFIEGDFSNEAYVQIYSVSGIPMAKYPLRFMKNKISIADLDQGVYMLRIKNGTQQITQKLIVK